MGTFDVFSVMICVIGMTFLVMSGIMLQSMGRREARETVIRAILFLVLFGAFMLIWRAMDSLSSDAIGVGLGVVAGVLAGVPTALLLMAWSRQQHRQSEEAHRSRQAALPAPEHQAPVIVMHGGQRLPERSSYRRAALPEYGSEPAPIERRWANVNQGGYVDEDW